MGGEVPDKNPEPPVEASQPAETAEAKAAREAAEQAQQEAAAKALADVEKAEAADKAKAEDPEKEMQEALDALKITTNPEEITMTPGPDPNANPEGKVQEAKSEGGFFNTITGGLASTMEPLVSNLLARTAERLKKDGTSDWRDSLSDALLKGLVQISLWLNPKAPWAEKLFADEKTKELFEKSLGMELKKDQDGNYNCTFEAVLQPEALPCSPANELLSRYLGEGTLPEFKRGQSIGDLKGALAAVPADSPEKTMADLMLKNIAELGVDDKTTLSTAFKSGFGRKLEDRLALLTGDEQTLVTSSLARHETEAQSTEASEGGSTLEALNLGEGITMETPLTPELLTNLSTVDATGSEDLEKVKAFASKSAEELKDYKTMKEFLLAALA